MRLFKNIRQNKDCLELILKGDKGAISLIIRDEHSYFVTHSKTRDCSWYTHQDSCHIIEGGCYCDTGLDYRHHWFDTYILKGEDFVWDMIEELYINTFKEI